MSDATAPRPSISVRASGADRDRCAAELAEAYSLGFLDEDTFQARLDCALVVTTREELAALVADLPAQPDGQVGVATASHGGLTQRAWMSIVGSAVALVAAGGLIQTGTPREAVAQPVCSATGVATPEEETCPVPTRAQRSLQRSVDRADSAAAQALEATEGSADGSRAKDLAREAGAAAERAHAAQAQAQKAVAAGEPGAQDAVAAAVRRARNAASLASQAAIDAGQEASR